MVLLKILFSPREHSVSLARVGGFWGLPHLISVHLSSFPSLPAVDSSELLILGSDLVDDRNELHGFSSLFIYSRGLILNINAHQIVPSPVMYDTVNTFGHRINGVNRKGMAPLMFIFHIKPK